MSSQLAGAPSLINAQSTSAQNQRLTVGTCGITHADSDGDTFLRLINPYGIEVTYSDEYAVVLKLIHTECAFNPPPVFAAAAVKVQ